MIWWQNSNQNKSTKEMAFKFKETNYKKIDETIDERLRHVNSNNAFMGMHIMTMKYPEDTYF